MAIQSTNVPDSDYSYGIDARSAENQIQPGFVRDLLNADIVERRAKKRRGYQGYAGNVPVRVKQLVYDSVAHEACFILDESISLENTPESPITVFGRSSLFTTGQGPFTTSGDTVRYYSAFLVPLLHQLTAPSGTLVLPRTAHGFSTPNFMVATAQPTSATNHSWTAYDPDNIIIDESNLDVSIQYTVPTTISTYVYFLDSDTVPSQSYVATATVAPGTHTISIPSLTSGLPSGFLVTRAYLESGSGTRSLVEPDSVTITGSDVTIQLTNGTGAPQTYTILLLDVGPGQITSGPIAAGSTGTVTIGGLSSPWLFYDAHLSLSAGVNQEKIAPDSAVYNDATRTLTLSFTNHMNVPALINVYYQYGTLKSNELCVTDSSVTTDGTDTAPQLTIWGLDHTEIYPPKVAREGWVSYIDSYRRAAEARMLCGLGGNLFSSRTYAEAGAQYAYPLLYPNLFVRTDDDLVLGPLFWDTGETPARTRGYITSDTVPGFHWVTVSAVQFDSSNGWTKYTLQVPNKQILDSTGAPTTLSSVISTTAHQQDWLQVEDMSYAIHNGTFRIRQVQDGTNQITVWVENASGASDYDDLGTGGSAGVFTDQITSLVQTPFIPGDVLVSSELEGNFLCTVLSSAEVIIPGIGVTVIDGLVGRLPLPLGTVLTANRTSRVIPLRSASQGLSPDPSSTLNMIRGDMLSYTGIPRLLRVLDVHSEPDHTIGLIVSTGGTATVTVSTTDLHVGMSVLLIGAGDYSGVVVVSSITDSSHFTFQTSIVGSNSGGILKGHTITVDEELAWGDTTSGATFFRCEMRWIPIESPTDSFNYPGHTHPTYFDVNGYTDQPFMRSTMVADNMYLTNGSDPVYKYDGDRNYRAGLIAWQPGLFMTQDTASSAPIVAGLRTVSYSASNAPTGRLTIGINDQNALPVGTDVLLPGDPLTYKVVSYTDNGDTQHAATAYYLNVDRALAAGVSASGNVQEVGVYRYYFRLNAVDANNNIIASAVTGSQDNTVQLVANAAINIKLVGLPVWDIYDYSHLEVQIYRTRINQPAPFYLVTTLKMSFDVFGNYLLFTDSFADTDLTELDTTSSVLKAGELGIGWSDPLRAKYVTSANNQLILGNITDYPQLDMQIVAPASIDNSSFSGGSLLFRRDSADTGTSSNMVDRVRYEWVTSTSGTPAYITFSPQSYFVVRTTQQASVGDWIYLTYSSVATSGRDLTLSGWFQISGVAGSGPYDNVLAYSHAPASLPAAAPDRYVLANTHGSVPVLLGTDGNLGQVNGGLFDLFDVMRRTSLAINASMRSVDTENIPAMSPFRPWMVSRGGNDTPPAGRLVVRQPNTQPTTLSVVPSFSGFELFINSVSTSSGASTPALTRVYPSRIIASYQNYPEIFDNPTSILDIQSDSAVDVNSSDGQQITGIIPFFGEAAFTAAQQAAILVVFKENSIYLVDLNQKKLGQNPVQRLETEGLGCTAPYSIASTKNGILFANASGMYCLRRTQSIDYVGKYMERNWQGRVDTSNLGIAQGHHYGIGRFYRLSIPLLEDETSLPYIENNEVYVYDHTLEGTMGATYGVARNGSWGRYDSIPAVGWANLNSDEFYASSEGRVLSLRRTGTASDYRDSSDAINMVLDLRPNDFGAPGMRKVLDAIIIHYRSGSLSTSTQVNYSIDLSQEYDSTTPVVINPTAGQMDDLSDPVQQDVVTIRHNIQRRRGGYFNMQLINNGLDENVEIVGVDYKVGGLSEKGYTQAVQTTQNADSR